MEMEWPTKYGRRNLRLYVNLYVQLYLINVLFVYVVTIIKYNLFLNFILPPLYYSFLIRMYLSLKYI
jgi:hypothetical protein